MAAHTCRAAAATPFLRSNRSTAAAPAVTTTPATTAIAAAPPLRSSTLGSSSSSTPNPSVYSSLRRRRHAPALLGRQQQPQLRSWCRRRWEEVRSSAATATTSALTTPTTARTEAEVLASAASGQLWQPSAYSGVVLGGHQHQQQQRPAYAVGASLDETLLLNDAGEVWSRADWESLQRLSLRSLSEEQLVGAYSNMPLLDLRSVTYPNSDTKEQQGRARVSNSSSGNSNGNHDNDSKEESEYHCNVGKAILTLQEDLPQLMVRKPNYDIYRDDIVFSIVGGQLNDDGEPKRHLELHGLDKYKMVFWTLRTQGQAIFGPNARIRILRIWQPWENKERVINVRWCFDGNTRLLDLSATVDGVSEYKLDKTGKIYEHRVNNIIMNDTFSTHTASFLGLASKQRIPLTPC